MLSVSLLLDSLFGASPGLYKDRWWNFFGVASSCSNGLMKGSIFVAIKLYQQAFVNKLVQLKVSASPVSKQPPNPQGSCIISAISELIQTVAVSPL